MRTLVFVVVGLGLMESVLAQTLHDTFDASTLDLKKWLTLQVRPARSGLPDPDGVGVQP